MRYRNVNNLRPFGGIELELFELLFALQKVKSASKRMSSIACPIGTSRLTSNTPAMGLPARAWLTALCYWDGTASGHAQFSTRSSGTRLNSLTLLVTSRMLRLGAAAVVAVNLPNSLSSDTLLSKE